MVDNSRTAAKDRSAQVLRNSPRAMPLLGLNTNFPLMTKMPYGDHL